MLLLQDIVIAIKSVEQKIKVFGLLYFNFILGMSVSMKQNVLRVGLNYKQRFQFGLGTDLAQFGMSEATFE
ncbi:MAG: hypothetical protein EBV19_06540, partial [Flavobacteriia bacterium]|nr:hypothetical protein [Flavobacteriia bacterium]